MPKLDPHGEYWMYLRKSRADRDAEAHGEGETLARHQKLLYDLAERLGVGISRVYREIVSGESITDRPEVQRMLRDLSAGSCDGVLVVEVERLARGDTSDQGTIAKYFKYSDTLIITPSKIYDPNDEFDEEYFEFGLFMSRREYKTINRRIQRGRRASVEEGKWIASTAPYGYERVRIQGDRGFTLQPVPEQAKVVQLIYDLYTIGEELPDGSHRRLGHHLIAKKLDAMGVHPMNSTRWSKSTIKDMLHNPTYIGKITFGREVERKMIVDGQQKKVRTRDPDCVLYDGVHPPIIDPEQFAQVQELEKSRPVYPVASNKALKNQLSGLVYCAECGQMMTRLAPTNRTPYGTLACPRRGCTTVSAPLYLVEQKLLDALGSWLEAYRLAWSADSHISNQPLVLQDSIGACSSELQIVEDQRNRAYDLLEQGVYTTEVFKARMDTLSQKFATLSEKRNQLQQELDEAAERDFRQNDFIPRVQEAIDTYWTLDDMAARNNLLKGVLSRATYRKNKQNTRSQRDFATFQLEIFPKIPR